MCILLFVVFAEGLIGLGCGIGKTILVPLTNSLYVPGKLCDPDHVIVDVGTGYFVRKVRLPTVLPYAVDPSDNRRAHRL